MRVLLFADDDKDVRQYVKNALSLIGNTHVHFIFVSSTAEAQAILDGVEPTFMLLDFELGDGTALDIIEYCKIKSQRVPKYAIMTGYTYEDLVSLCEKRKNSTALITNAEAVLLKEEANEWLSSFVEMLIAYAEEVK